MKDNKILHILAAIVLAVLAIFIIAKTRNVLAERDYIGKAVKDRDVITLNGQGKITAKPDLAEVALSVMTDGATPAIVQADNTKKMNSIIEAVKSLGVKDDDLQTSGYSLQPKIDWNSGRQNIVGYTVSQILTVKVRDFNKIGDVLQMSTDKGANQLSGVQFTIDDPTSLQDEARLKAIKEATKKAEALTDALGLHIVKVVSFNESSASQPPGPYPMMANAMDEAMKSAPAPDIQAGSLDVVTTVSVTFEIR